MVNRVGRAINTFITIAVVMCSVEYFKIWTKNNYDIMHCYTRVNEINDSNIFRITSNGTISCDTEAQQKQINKKLDKLVKDENWFYCIDEDEKAEKVIDKMVGYYGKDELALNEYCKNDVLKLL